MDGLIVSAKPNTNESSHAKQLGKTKKPVTENPTSEFIPLPSLDERDFRKLRVHGVRRTFPQDPENRHAAVGKRRKL